MKFLLDLVRGIGGEPEIIRTSGAFGLVAFVLSVIGFTIWHMAAGKDFDVIAYCASFSGGLVAIYGAVAGAVALKDRNVATAKATEAQATAEAANA